MSNSGGNVKITVVGDGVVGKTCLLVSYTANRFPEEHVPTVFENYSKEISVDGIVYNMTLWDTAGQEDYERLRPLTYPHTNCFLICFSVDSGAASYENVLTKWAPEVRHFNAHIPFIIVATKTDLRDDPSIRCYTTQDGKKLKRKAKAQGYCECSAKNQEGLEELFVEAIRVHRKHRIIPRKTNCTIL